MKEIEDYRIEKETVHKGIIWTFWLKRPAALGEYEYVFDGRMRTGLRVSFKKALEEWKARE